MTDPYEGPSTSTLLRWSTLILIGANLGFINVYGRITDPLMPGALALVLQGNVFVPRGIALAAASAVAVSFILFYAVILWPRRRQPPVYDRLALPIAASAFVVSALDVAIRNGADAFSLALIGGLAALAAAMFVVAARVSPRQRSGWLRVPFSLHFALTTLVFVGALTDPSLAARWLPQLSLAPEDLTCAALVLVVVVGGAVALRYHEFVYPSVMSAILLTVPFVASGREANVALAMYQASAGLAIVAVLAAIASARDMREVRQRLFSYGRSDTPTSAPVATSAPPPPGKPMRRERQPARRPSAATQWRNPFEGDSSLTRP